MSRRIRVEHTHSLTYQNHTYTGIDKVWNVHAFNTFSITYSLRFIYAMLRETETLCIVRSVGRSLVQFGHHHSVWQYSLPLTLTLNTIIRISLSEVLCCALKIMLHDCNWFRIDTVIFRISHFLWLANCVRCGTMHIALSLLVFPCSVFVDAHVFRRCSFRISCNFFPWFCWKKNEKCLNRLHILYPYWR